MQTLTKSSVVTLVLFVVLIVLTYVLCVSSRQYTPYTPHTLFPTHYAYEGMTAGREEKPSAVPQVPGTVPGTMGNINEHSRETWSPSESSVTPPIDPYSQVTATGVDGKDGCVSSGLSNSKGQLCLPDNLVQLLKTRGGNA